jgi:tryptophan 7-halogenase
MVMNALGRPIRDVVVVGGGTAGWMAAAALARYLAPGLNIRLVESDAIGIIGVGEATIPQIKRLNAALGIDEADFIARTNGSFKLGIEFINWRRKGHAYLHTFGTIGMNLSQIHFHNYLARARAAGYAHDLWDHCINTAAARRGRFAALDKVGTSPLAGINYAYHFDASLYAGFLREYAEKRGVKRVEGRIVETLLDSESGDITSVRLESGQDVAGDFFIDCSGFIGLLIGKALGTGYQDWSKWLKSDRAFAVPSENDRPIRPYTQSIAHDAGWQWRIPLQHRTGNGHVFSSAYTSEDAARDTLLANLEGKPLAEPRLIKFTTGRRELFWNRNCVALGLASGFLEPLESTSIHLVQSGISRLIALFPNHGINPVDRDEYNTQMGMEFERIRDFLILHYTATERDDTPFWRDMRAMELPDTLRHKIGLFSANGRLFHLPEDLFTDSSWLQVMLGQGIEPQGWHPIADHLSDSELFEFLDNIRALVSGAAERLPTHEAFIRQHCASPAAMVSRSG